MLRPMERLCRSFSWLAALGTMSVMVFYVGFLVLQGFKTINMRLFFGDVPFWQAATGKLPVWHGIWPACVGTLLLVLLSAFIAIPLGVGSGIYLAQYAGQPWKGFISFTADVLSGMPSILMGLFGFELILFLRQTMMPTANTGLLPAAGCIALLILPYLVLTTRTALEGLPDAVKMAGPSLGMTSWQNTWHILLPAASSGMVSGIILAIGRAAEDTAVIMLTGVVANAGLPRTLTDKFEALPFNIYYLAAEHRNPVELDQAFGSALVLLFLTTALFLTAQGMRKIIAPR
jgi:phosphate transport system permease protein